MNIETGTPTMDGRYVVYVPGLLGWLEPHIVTWQRGEWYFMHSTQKYPDKVEYWIGPLPVVMLDPGAKIPYDPTAQNEFPDESPPQEFDL